MEFSNCLEATKCEYIWCYIDTWERSKHRNTKKMRKQEKMDLKRKRERERESNRHCSKIQRRDICSMYKQISANWTKASTCAYIYILFYRTKEKRIAFVANIIKHEREFKSIISIHRLTNRNNICKLRHCCSQCQTHEALNNFPKASFYYTFIM